MDKLISLVVSVAIGLQPTPFRLLTSTILPSIVEKTAAEQKAPPAPELPPPPPEPVVKEALLLWVTAYSSTPEETDDTPFVTAANTAVRHGIVATNMLPFGTRVKIPTIFGNEIFVVEDRMHERKVGFLDIWMPTKEQATKFGIKKAGVLVLAHQPEN